MLPPHSTLGFRNASLIQINLEVISWLSNLVPGRRMKMAYKNEANGKPATILNQSKSPIPFFSEK